MSAGGFGARWAKRTTGPVIASSRRRRDARAGLAYRLAGAQLVCDLPHPDQAPGLDQLCQGRVLDDVTVSNDQPFDRQGLEGLQRS